MKKLRKQLLLLAALLVLTLTGCEAQDLLSTERADSGSEVTAAYTMTESQITDQAPTAVSVLDVPEFSGEPYVVLNGNEPDFTDKEKTTESYEHYSDLDSLGRCGVAEANIGQDLMPTEKRGAIGQVKPTGWHTVKYDQVEGKYLYNRCHLIGYQLTGENANEKNLITGTRYLNVEVLRQAGVLCCHGDQLLVVKLDAQRLCHVLCDVASAGAVLTAQSDDRLCHNVFLLFHISP